MFKKSLIITSLLISFNTIAGPGLPGTSLAVPVQGELGYIHINPYGSAPLTAIISRAGKNISNVSVTVKGKENSGLDINYSVSNRKILNYDGIPIFGLYERYNNNIEVSYIINGSKKITENYRILTGAVTMPMGEGRVREFPEVTPIKVDSSMQDRLYWFNHLSNSADTRQLKWASGNGAADWDFQPLNMITDTKGEMRWFLQPDAVYDTQGLDLLHRGALMGVHQTSDGHFIFGQGQQIYKMDIMGRSIWEWRLPRGYIDFSHEINETTKGTYLVRVGKKDYVNDAGDVVNTIRDHIIEIDTNGSVIHEWDLNEILDNKRDALLSALDVGAVCLNIDLSKEGQQMTMEDIHNAPYGDIPGINAGRNWAHVNSISYDPSDDTIVISMRHQGSAKIGYDNKVKWILSAKKGWKAELADKVLTPVDSNGKKINCDENGICEGNFDVPWTQHTTYVVPEKGTLVSFDNGDGRGMATQL